MYARHLTSSTEYTGLDHLSINIENLYPFNLIDEMGRNLQRKYNTVAKYSADLGPALMPLKHFRVQT